ncbi:hypothetical protein CCACVL1_30762 [Corchorus capsularis]|uniref:Uncharacterized protein n=1 Tax=Corchorus capsularis TaxID=210143 RepID=A0A1R3FVM5_COCAP|nr:hypothetical protein CCACVL1_30762 [Corchorus capsularis]
MAHGLIKGDKVQRGKLKTLNKVIGEMEEPEEIEL